MAVGEVRVLLLQMPTVGQQNVAKVAGRTGAMDRPLESVANEERQTARVVEMGVGQDDRIDPFRVYRELLPVAQAQLLEALKEAAIDEDPAIGDLHEVFRAGDCPDAAEKRDVVPGAAIAFPGLARLDALPDVTHCEHPSAA